MMDAGQFLELLSAGETERVVKGTKEALDAGMKAEDVLKQGLIPAMGEVGEKFRNGEVYIPEVMLAARAMKAAMEILKPVLTRSTGTAAGKVVIGAVKGDLHDIGKNLVVMMMEGGGFEAVDLGADVSAERFVDAVRNHRPAFVGFSALLTTTMKEMRQTILALEKAGLRSAVRVIVGGGAGHRTVRQGDRRRRLRAGRHVRRGDDAVTPLIRSGIGPRDIRSILKSFCEVTRWT